MFGSYTSRAKDVMVSTGLDYAKMRNIKNEIEKTSKSKSEARGRFAKAMFAVLIINSMAVVGRDELRDKLYDRESKLSFFSKILKSWSGLIFGVRDISNAIFRSLERGTSYGISVDMSPVSAVPELTKDMVFNFVEALDGDEDAALKALDKAAELSLTAGMGLPYKPVRNIIRTIGE